MARDGRVQQLQSRPVLLRGGIETAQSTVVDCADAKELAQFLAASSNVRKEEMSMMLQTVRSFLNNRPRLLEEHFHFIKCLAYQFEIAVPSLNRQRQRLEGLGFRV